MEKDEYDMEESPNESEQSIPQDPINTDMKIDLVEVNNQLNAM